MIKNLFNLMKYSEKVKSSEFFQVFFGPCWILKQFSKKVRILGRILQTVRSPKKEEINAIIIIIIANVFCCISYVLMPSYPAPIPT